MEYNTHRLRMDQGAARAWNVYNGKVDSIAQPQSEWILGFFTLLLNNWVLWYCLSVFLHKGWGRWFSKGIWRRLWTPRHCFSFRKWQKWKEWSLELHASGHCRFSRRRQCQNKVGENSIWTSPRRHHVAARRIVLAAGFSRARWIIGSALVYCGRPKYFGPPKMSAIWAKCHSPVPSLLDPHWRNATTTVLLLGTG